MGTARETISKYASQAQLETYFVAVLGLISVKSYGALGDGSTDDSAAITSALAALSSAGGKSLYFPTGVYKVDNVTITAASFAGLYLWGDNSSFTGITLPINQIGAAATSGVAVLTTEGDTLYRGPLTEERLAKGTAGQMLVMNPGETAPEWADSPSVVLSNPGDTLYTDSGGDQVALPIGDEDQILSVGGGGTPIWKDGFDTVLTTEGDIPYIDSSGNPERLPKGTAGQVLTMDAEEAAPEWADSPATIMTRQGDLLYVDGASKQAQLSTSFDNYVLTTGATGGLPEWRAVDVVLGTKIWRGPIAAYNAIVTKDPKTLYFCTTAGGQYLLTYDGNGADGGHAPDYTYREENEFVTVEDNTFSKSFYTFDSWNTQADGLGVDWDPDDVFQMGASDLVLYAIWAVS